MMNSEGLDCMEAGITLGILNALLNSSHLF